MNKKNLYAALSGAIFGLGLVVAGMTQPLKIINFLNLAGFATGNWDPSLALVMGGGLVVSLIAFARVPKAAKPWADVKFELPTRTDIDFKLVLGGVLFGLGWGLGGYCPGPGFASLITGGADALYFVLAMLVGMFAAKKMWA